MNRRRFLIPVVVILIVLIGAALYLLFSDRIRDVSENGNGIADGGGGFADSLNGGSDINGNPDESGDDGSNAGSPAQKPVDLKPHYYDESLEDRYAVYADLHPELTEEEIYWMAACDQDKPTYEDTVPVPDPTDPMALVNKHYHLPSDYVPGDLVSVGSTMLREEAAGALQEMIDAAAAEGHTLWSQSGFRSYETQAGLYEAYSARDGQEAADTYSARPGYSEHQTGLATDLNTITDAFADTPEGQWAAENAWRFGYIMRYTQENTDIVLYKYEPWHFRYIGKDAAKVMHDEGIISYEEYWVEYVKYPI